MKTRLLLILAALIGLCAMSMPVFKYHNHTDQQPTPSVRQMADHQPRDSEKK